jgi:hypothetical protein
MKEIVYIETSFVSLLVAAPSRDVSAACASMPESPISMHSTNPLSMGGNFTIILEKTRF